MSRFGDLDASFGSNGLVITDFSGNESQATSVAIDPSNGKIIVAGYTNVNRHDDFALACYLSNGSLDTSFGSNGIVITDFGGEDFAKSVAIKPDSKIIVAGTKTSNDYSNSNFALACYLSNGSLDASFGSNGLVITDFSGNNSQGYSLAIKPDGKIIVAGNTYTNTNFNFALACYLSNGTLDASFGSNGLVITDFGGDEFVSSVAIDPSNGKIIVSGYKYTNTNFNFALACYLSNGTLDASFGSNGLVITDFGGDEFANSVTIKPDGKIIVAGNTYTNDYISNFALACYLSNGSLDASFGSNGLVITGFSGNNDYEANSVTTNPYGKIIVSGYTNVNDNNDFVLACYLSNGSLDASFGSLGNGKVNTDFANSSDKANSVAINQTNGNIIVAGYTGYSGSRDFALASYFGEVENPIEEVENPISNICFPANTLISTNQGNIAIQDLDPKIHTIRKKKIELITKTITQNKYLVCFEKDSLGKNLPSEKTIITKNHAIYYKGSIMKAKDFINKFENVKKIKYTGEILYNVLMEEHDKMMVNNLICETLHPENTIVELYKFLSKMPQTEQQKIIKEYNDYSIKNNIFSSKR